MFGQIGGTYNLAEPHDPGRPTITAAGPVRRHPPATGVPQSAGAKARVTARLSSYT